MSRNIHDVEKSALTILIFSLFVGLAANIFSFISVTALLGFVALQGVFATLMIQPIFHFLLGIKAYKDVKVNHRWCDLKTQMEDIISELPGINMPALSYKNDPTANAFAIGGLMTNGLICVNSGLVEKIDLISAFPEELKNEVRLKLHLEMTQEPTIEQIKAHLLKAVLAHELGHLNYHHGIKKSFVDQSIRNIFRYIALLPLVRIRFISKIFKALFTTVPVSFYSRKCESQADSFAVQQGYAIGLKVALGEIFHTKDSPLDFHSQDYVDPILTAYQKISATHPSRMQRIRDIDAALSSENSNAGLR